MFTHVAHGACVLFNTLYTIVDRTFYNKKICIFQLETVIYRLPVIDLIKHYIFINFHLLWLDYTIVGNLKNKTIFNVIWRRLNLYLSKY